MLTRLKRWKKRLRARLAERTDLVLENVALRQQLAMYERRDRARGHAFHGHDRLFWCLIARFWPRWREPLKVVQPETVMPWGGKTRSSAIRGASTSHVTDAPT
jgi:hypothetical protein